LRRTLDGEDCEQGQQADGNCQHATALIHGSRCSATRRAAMVSG
jgi:hypothetical protein